MFKINQLFRAAKVEPIDYTEPSELSLNAFSEKYKISVNARHLKITAFGFIYLGIIMFAAGFLKILPAILFLAVIAICFANLVKHSSEDEVFYIDLRSAAAAALFIALFLILSGQLGICKQYQDWAIKNALLRDLTERKWPIYYSDGSALSYYVMPFLPAAFVGKITGNLTVTHWAMFLYLEAGLLLSYLYMIKVTKSDTASKQIFVILAFLLFGSFEDLRMALTDLWTALRKIWDPDFSGTSVMIGFTSIYKSFMGPFNQSVIGILGMIMVMDDDFDLSDSLFLGVGALLYSPFMTIVMAIICAVKTVWFIKNHLQIKTIAKKFLTVHNLLALAIILPVFVLFIWGNITREKPDILNFKIIDYSGKWYLYILFVLSETGLFFVLMLHKYKRNPYFYTLFVITLILPLFQFGKYNDVCTRGTTACLVGMFVLIIRMLFENKTTRTDKTRAVAMLITLLMVSTASLCMCRDSALDFTKSVAEGNRISSKWNDPYMTLDDIQKFNATDLTYNFFAPKAKDEQFFFKYLAK